VALEKFWADKAFETEVKRKGDHLKSRLEAIAERYGLTLRGRGMMRGINTGNGETASAICKRCFDDGLIIETSGADDEIVKVLAPLTIDMDQFNAGLDIMEDAFEAVLGHERPRNAAE
jgi:diaminobutyrate-2-oxoglutarate transaminase